MEICSALEVSVADPPEFTNSIVPGGGGRWNADGVRVVQ